MLLTNKSTSNKAKVQYLSAIPYLPSRFSLTDEHLVTILRGCSVLSAHSKEAGLSGIVHQVEKQVVGSEQFVWDVGTLIDVGERAQGGTINDDTVFAEQSLIEVSIGNHTLTRAARYRERLDSQLPQPVLHRQRCSTRAEHQRLRVVGLQQGADGLAEPDDISIEPTHVANADDINGFYLLRTFIEAAEQWNHILLVRYRYIQPNEIGTRLNQRASIPSFANFSVKY